MFCTNDVRWRYCLDHDHSWQSGHRFERDWAFVDRTGTVRLILRTDGTITVTRGYAWDGCTPKFCLFDLSVGVPDGVVHARTGKPKTYYASLIHDALYQFLPDDLPLTRRQADDCFLRLLARDDFAPRYIYYAAVRLLGGLFRKGGRMIRKTAGRRVRYAPPHASP
jgi:hypothetical protein